MFFFNLKNNKKNIKFLGKTSNCSSSNFWGKHQTAGANSPFPLYSLRIRVEGIKKLKQAKQGDKLRNLKICKKLIQVVKNLVLRDSKSLL